MDFCLSINMTMTLVAVIPDILVTHKLSVVDTTNTAHIQANTFIDAEQGGYSICHFYFCWQ